MRAVQGERAEERALLSALRRGDRHSARGRSAAGAEAVEQEDRARAHHEAAALELTRFAINAIAAIKRTTNDDDEPPVSQPHVLAGGSEPASLVAPASIASVSASVGHFGTHVVVAIDCGGHCSGPRTPESASNGVHEVPSSIDAPRTKGFPVTACALGSLEHAYSVLPDVARHWIASADFCVKARSLAFATSRPAFVLPR